MALNIDQTLFAAISAVVGGILVKAFDFFFPSKKDRVDTGKVSTETALLTKAEQRTEAKFCQEQLIILENKFIAQTTEMEIMRKKFKELNVMYDELERNHNEVLNDFTFLKIKLAAYEI